MLNQPLHPTQPTQQNLQATTTPAAIAPYLPPARRLLQLAAPSNLNPKSNLKHYAEQNQKRHPKHEPVYTCPHIYPSEGEQLYERGCNRCNIGSCIIPIMIDPTFNGVYVVLGKECKRLEWMQNADLWCPFGGAKAATDTSPHHTAAREYIEETFGLVGAFSNISSLQAMLQEKQYLFKVTSIQHKLRGPSKHSPYITYTTYFLGLPWNIDCINAFNTKAATMDHIEKTQIRLWSIPQLRNATLYGGVLTSANGQVERCTPIFYEFLKRHLADIMQTLSR